MTSTSAPRGHYASCFAQRAGGGHASAPFCVECGEGAVEWVEGTGHSTVNTPDPGFLGFACCLDINLETQPYHCFVPEPAEEKPVVSLAILLSSSEDTRHILPSLVPVTLAAQLNLLQFPGAEGRNSLCEAVTSSLPLSNSACDQEPCARFPAEQPGVRGPAPGRPLVRAGGCLFQALHFPSGKAG